MNNLVIDSGNCKKCDTQLSIAGMQQPWCHKCEPEKDYINNPQHKLYVNNLEKEKQLKEKVEKEGCGKRIDYPLPPNFGICGSSKILGKKQLCKDCQEKLKILEINSTGQIGYGKCSQCGKINHQCPCKLKILGGILE